MTSIEKFNSLLKLAVQHGASDIHLKTKKNPVFRIDGKLRDVDTSPFSMSDLLEILDQIVPLQFKQKWERDFQIDFSHMVSGAGRFRVNAFYQRATPGVVLRHVKDKIPHFDEINLDPAPYEKICSCKNGIALICGATGSGKSTTLAAMINHINQNLDRHIVTLEDPIEYSYTDQKSIINQREIGIDTPSFDLGITAAMRQDPDVILVGEMRDADTFTTAIRAAETGHLVFGTLHASSSQQAIQRLFEFFPTDMQETMRPQVAGSIRATVTQKLIPAVEGGRVPVNEIFWVDALGRQVIEDGEFEKVARIVESQDNDNCRSFNADLLRLVNEGRISKSEALNASPHPQKLEMNLKGIFLSGGGIVE
ncbi:MAG: PilT/PilU family type 4a pilus ATPase [Opitutales bacterium]|nr:PilT/PilU family type 4a pilus ATPase [Opitutales bacterium]